MDSTKFLNEVYRLVNEAEAQGQDEDGAQKCIRQALEELSRHVGLLPVSRTLHLIRAMVNELVDPRQTISNA